jgi:hypothetical protein
MAQYLDSLDNYCLRRTRHTTDSYPNFFHVVEHKLSAYLLESDLLFGLTMRLRMISRTEMQLGIQGFMQPLPKL